MGCRVFASALMMTMVVWSAPILASPEQDAVALKQVCAQRAEDGQRDRDLGRLIAARASFLECAQPRCPSVVQSDCTTFADDVGRRTPSIIISAKLQDGSDVTRLVVSVDGKLVANANAGMSIAVDPGEHFVQVANPDTGGTAERRLVLHEAEKRRVVAFVLPPGDSSATTTSPRPSSPSPSTSHPFPVLAVVGGAGALVGFGIATALVLGARGSVSELRRTCAPHCAPDTVDPIRTRVSAAYVSGALGVAFLAIGTDGLITWWVGDRAALTVAPTNAGARVLAQYRF